MNTSPHILLVDDDDQVVRYLRRTLEEEGYAVTTATSGKQGLAHIEERMPDLLILDLNMPPPDGFELLKSKRSKFPGLRVLVISGCLEGALLEAARLFGATATLEKPVTAETLIGKVRDCLEEGHSNAGRSRRRPG
jgi:DNA-binding NtrC family response regulator